ncbi:MAG: DUF4962 domain-containing protein [Thermodesulfobacteriota bacterium]|nr:DUF4962 domain-containing protein [Thermodesulfobacteriota bacterium]
MNPTLKKGLISIVIGLLILHPSPLWEMFPNLIPNPDFKEGSNGDHNPYFWEKEVGHGGLLGVGKSGVKGENAIFIKGKGTWRCTIKGIVPDRYYLFSIWVKRDGFMDGEYPQINMFDRTFRLNELFCQGGWVNLSWLIQSKEQRHTTISLQSPGMSHKLWFDSLYMTELKILPISPTKGKTIKKGRPAINWLLPENHMVLSVQVQLSQDKDFNNTLVFENSSPQGNLYRVKEKLRDGKWYWRVSVYKNRKEIDVSDRHDFLVKDSKDKTDSELIEKVKKSIDLSKRNLHADFFPIGIYGVGVEDIPDLKEAGFNSIQTYVSDIDYLRLFINKAERCQVKAMIKIPNEAWKTDLSAFFFRVRHSKGILSWYLEDEPEGRGIPPSYIWRLNNYIHKMDPTHPTSLVLVRSKKAYDYGDGVDILMVDPYPIPSMPITWLSDSIDEARKAVFNEKPIWAVIQAFDWSAYPVQGDKREWGRNPTFEEERCLTYLAVVHGVKGIFYYTFKGGNYSIKDYPDHWNDIKKIVWELNRIYPLLLAPAIDHNLEIQIEPSRSHPQRLTGIHYSIRKVDNRHLKKHGSKMKEGTYLIAVNVTDKPLQMRMHGTFLNEMADVVFENRKIKTQERSLTDSFAPYEVHIYGI